MGAEEMRRGIARRGWEGAQSARPMRVRACHVRADEEGAAGVVAILLAILIVLLLVTLITSVWLPVWMKDREAKHMRAATSDFSNMKATIDNLVIQKDTNIIVSSPLQLGTEGIPIFGSDSTGTFSINYFRGAVPEFSCNVRNQTGALNITCTGGMKYISRNINYVNQELAYENGAILLTQGGGEVVRVGPQFTIEKLGPIVRVSFVLISVSGVETSMEGVGTVLVSTQLVTFTSASYQFAASEWLNITVLTEYPTGWFRYFNNALTAAGLNPATDFVESISGNTVTVAIMAVKYFDMGYALVEADLQA
jgi:hypothetical protein